ncbi:hypothetical protein ACFQ51_43435 [Streptomyces kaempferi]
MISIFGMLPLLSYYLRWSRATPRSKPVWRFYRWLPPGYLAPWSSGRDSPAARAPLLLTSGGSLVTTVGLLLLDLLRENSSYSLLDVAEIITGLGIGTAFMPAMSPGTTESSRASQCRLHGRRLPAGRRFGHDGVQQRGPDTSSPRGGRSTA